MDKCLILPVHNETDIILARLRVRELARAQGFNVMNQARVSLAASSLARTLGLGGTHRGQITVEGLQDGGRSTGVRVVCTKTDGAEADYGAQTFDDLRLMVDELTVEELPSADLQVTMTKWRV